MAVCPELRKYEPRDALGWWRYYIGYPTSGGTWRHAGKTAILGMRDVVESRELDHKFFLPPAPLIFQKENRHTFYADRRLSMFIALTEYGDHW
jgi:hypothetical protein